MMYQLLLEHLEGNQHYAASFIFLISHKFYVLRLFYSSIIAYIKTAFHKSPFYDSSILLQLSLLCYD
jgi:hypothetical protein